MRLILWSLKVELEDVMIIGTLLDWSFYQFTVQWIKSDQKLEECKMNSVYSKNNSELISFITKYLLNLKSI